MGLTFSAAGTKLRQIQDCRARYHPGRSRTARHRVTTAGFPKCGLDIRRTPHPAIVAIRDNKDYIRVLLYSYYTTITGCWRSS